MNSDDLKVADNLFKYYDDINANILESINSKRSFNKQVPNSRSCYCVMGHTDIRTIKACSHCTNLYYLSSFKEPCENYVFKCEAGKYENKFMIIKHFPHTINISKRTVKNINNDYTEDKIAGHCIINSSFYNNILSNSLIIGDISERICNKILAHFICMFKGFQLSRHRSIKIHRLPTKLITDLIKQLASKLRVLKKYQFMHGNAILDNLTILEDENKYDIVLDNLNYSSITKDRIRYYYGGEFGSENNIPITKEDKYFTITGDHVTLDNIIKYEGIPIYPCVLDFYMFVISILCDEVLYNKLIDDEYFMNDVFKKMFYDYDYEKVTSNLIFDFKVTSVDCLSILRDIKMKYNVLELI